MLEGYTLLGGLAARTRTARLGTLVTGVTYRNPAILAKIVTTLDVISSGRAFLGIGAAWFDVEHAGPRGGLPAGEGAVRAPRGGPPHLPGDVPGRAPHHRGQALPGPGRHQQPGPGPGRGPADHDRRPGGEEDPAPHGPARRDGQLHAAASTSCPASSRCWPPTAPTWAEIRATINKTSLCTGGPGDTMEEAVALRNAFLAGPGPGLRRPSTRRPRPWSAARLIVGDPDAVGEQVQRLMALGLDGITFNLPANGHDPEAVAATVRTSLVEGRGLTRGIAGPLDGRRPAPLSSPGRAPGPLCPEPQTELTSGQARSSGTARHNRTTLRRAPRAERSREPGPMPRSSAGRDTVVMATKAIVGEKVGMTQVWDDENRVVPVTVLRVKPCRVVQVKTDEHDGYTALQVTFGTTKASKLSKPKAGHFEKAGGRPGSAARRAPPRRRLGLRGRARSSRPTCWPTATRSTSPPSARARASPAR